MEGLRHIVLAYANALICLRHIKVVASDAQSQAFKAQVLEEPGLLQMLLSPVHRCRKAASGLVKAFGELNEHYSAAHRELVRCSPVLASLKVLPVVHICGKIRPFMLDVAFDLSKEVMLCIEATRAVHNKADDVRQVIAADSIGDFFDFVQGRGWPEKGIAEAQARLETEFNIVFQVLEDLGIRDADKGEHLKPQETGQSAARQRARKTSRRSYTQAELDAAITEEIKRHRDLIVAASEGKPGANREAKKIFERRNALADRLGVKSRRMVSKSIVWLELAETVGLPRKSKEGLHQGPRRKIGLDIALEQKASGDGSSQLDTVVRRETQDIIETAIQSAGTKKLREQVEATRDKYELGEMTDEQALATIDLLLGG